MILVTVRHERNASFRCAFEEMTLHQQAVQCAHKREEVFSQCAVTIPETIGGSDAAVMVKGLVYIMRTQQIKDTIPLNGGCDNQKELGKELNHARTFIAVKELQSL